MRSRPAAITRVLSVLLLAGAVQAQQALKYDHEKLPFRAQWGPYALLAEKSAKGEFAPEHLLIRDEAGATVREVSDAMISGLEFVKLSPSGSPALHVTTYTGGAHCCTADYFFTRDGAVKNVLIYRGGNSGINGIKDLNGDGRPEIIAGNDALAYFGELPYAASPHLMLIIGWDGKRYVDQTRRFPDRSAKLAEEYRASFLKGRTSRSEFAEMERRMNAGGYYANLYAIGRGAEARSWLLPRLSPATRGWFLKYEGEMRKAAASGNGYLTVSQEKLLQPPDEGK